MNNASNVNPKLRANTPKILESVCNPRIDDVGRVSDRYSAGLAKGKANAMVIVQTPSRKTQHQSENVI